MRAARLSSVLLTVGFLLPLAAQAGRFPDLTDTHVFRAEIEALAELGVIQGNPDGTFRPGDPVNRAAMLKMLYLAGGRTAPSPAAPCFPDVQAGSWYESFVCDAAAQGFVKGYADGTFKPARPVSRAEAIKMSITVLWNSADITTGITYADVAPSDWYASYVSTAIRLGLLPLRGRDADTLLRPDEPIDRAEAAALIWKGKNATVTPAASSSSSSAPAEAAASVSSQAAAASSAASQARARKKAVYDDTGATARVLTMTYPFADTQTFAAKTSFSYRFTLSSPRVAQITARLREGSAGGVTCTLFRMEKDGLSTEYYIGYTEGNACYLRVAAVAGDYQLQLSPTVANTMYQVETAVGKSDGSDGFSEASTLPFGKTRTGILEANDFEDWYTFTVSAERQMTFALTSGDSLRCIVYAGSDVDLFGFEGPACNKPYLYPVGTYHVGIGHAHPKALKQMYTVELK